MDEGRRRRWPAPRQCVCRLPLADALEVDRGLTVLRHRITDCSIHPEGFLPLFAHIMPGFLLSLRGGSLPENPAGRPEWMDAHHGIYRQRDGSPSATVPPGHQAGQVRRHPVIEQGKAKQGRKQEREPSLRPTSKAVLAY